MDIKSPNTIVNGAVATQFIDDLTEAMRKTLVTARNGVEMPLQKGLAVAVEMIAARRGSGGKLLLIGNGGSAAMASHGALDFWKNGEVEAMAFNDANSLTAVSNDYSYEEVFARPIRRFAKRGDLLLAISSSGSSPNILCGVEAAQEMGCEVVTLSGFDTTNLLRSMGDLNFWVPSGRYGIVETVHDGLRHAIVEELMQATARAKDTS